MLRSSENQSLWTCAQMKTSVDGEIPWVNASKQINAQTPVDWFPRAPAPHYFLRTTLITHRPTRPVSGVILAVSCPSFSSLAPSPAITSLSTSSTALQGSSAPGNHFPAASSRAFSWWQGPAAPRGWAGARGWSVNSRCAQKNFPLRCEAATAYLLNLVFLLHHTMPTGGRKNPTVPSLLWMRSSSFHQ